MVYKRTVKGTLESCSWEEVVVEGETSAIHQAWLQIPPGLSCTGGKRRYNSSSGGRTGDKSNREVVSA